MPSVRVVWKGPLTLSSGLGIASRAYVAALRRQGIRVLTGSDSSLGAIGKGHSPSVLICHQLSSASNLDKERQLYDRLLLNTVWETTRIPASWVPRINRFDALFVPSEQNRKAFRKSGVKIPIHLVPHGVDLRSCHPDHEKYPLPLSKNRFVFVSVFGFQHRKNPELLLRAYWEQFSDRDNVLLVIKTNGYAPHENGHWIRKRIERYKQELGIRKRTAPFVLLTDYLSDKKLRGLYTLGNVFVLPTRGEGVGLPFMEALASGTPVIATGWGGHMDFLNERNSFIVRYKLRKPLLGMRGPHAISRKFRSLFSGKDQRWAEPNLESLKSMMLEAYLHPAACRRKGRQGRSDMRKWSWDAAGASMKRAIDMTLAAPSTGAKRRAASPGGASRRQGDT
ncbi:glycosyltransferase family 4 protein [Cohnella fermenti]|uniref:Glycosyltransferase family 4 protein n=1 Tax=Cohnella fermenti TaxID=2565925 RepID=A0A4S4C852_9BACL|nr:glycosyltransferase family 4 protein [Cohnella fermenti]THF84192.1 glycosyltransferase family 4 protein [Cohnella fermenti]